MTTTLAPRRTRRRLASLLAVPVVAVVVLAGVWVTGGVVSDDFRTSMALTAAWFALSGAACAFVAWRVRALRVAVLGAYLVTAGVVGLYLGISTLRDRVVDERVVTAAVASRAPADGSGVAPAVEEARAPFRSLEHETTGTATVVRRRFLTLTGFETSPGPDLRVRVAPGDTTDGVADGAIDLGALKGNRGDQQYELPRGADVAGATVVIWCRAFSAPFGSARL